MLVSALLGFFLAGCGQDGVDSKSGAPEVPAASAQPVTDRHTDSRPVIVAFGDSLTAGHGLPPSASYPAQLQRRLDQSGFHYRVVNAGVSGETSSQGAARVQVVLDLRPEVVIVEFGANDGLRGVPVQATRKHLSEIVSSLQRAGAKVVLAGMLLPSNYGPQYLESFRTMFAEIARKHQAVLIPFFLEGVAGRDDLNLDDGVHPNEKGYAAIAETVLETLKPMLKKDKGQKR